MSGDNSQEFPGMPGEPEGSTAGSTTATSEPSRTVDGETGAGPESAATVADPADVLREERDKLRDQLLRTAADYDNFRKRTRKDLEESERRGREEHGVVADRVDHARRGCAFPPFDKSGDRGIGVVRVERVDEDAALHVRSAAARDLVVVPGV